MLLVNTRKERMIRIAHLQGRSVSALLHVRPLMIGQICYVTDFVEERRKYDAHISEMRKKWAEEHRLKVEKKKEEDAAMRRVSRLKKAVKLRKRIIDGQKGQEFARKSREEAMNAFRGKLAWNTIIREKQDAIRLKRFRAAITDLKAEQKCWITKSNMNDKITPELFEKPRTTGLVAKHSYYWRYQVSSADLDRFIYEMKQPEVSETDNKYGMQNIENRLKVIASIKLSKRMELEEFLNQMIGSGEERAKYQHLVKDFSAVFEDSDSQSADDRDMYNLTMGNMELSDDKSYRILDDDEDGDSDGGDGDEEYESASDDSLSDGDGEDGFDFEDESNDRRRY